MIKRMIAEFSGAFMIVLGGCGTAVLADMRSDAANFDHRTIWSQVPEEDRQPAYPIVWILNRANDIVIGDRSPSDRLAKFGAAHGWAIHVQGIPRPADFI